MLKPWWERWPGLLDEELQLLYDAGIIVERKEMQDNRLSLLLKLFVGDQQIRLIVVFPDTYPYVRFEAYAPELDLAHHQNPIGKNLCLIGRGTRHWSVSDRVAPLIAEQLPRLLLAVRTTDSEAASQIEEHQGEPFSNYYPYSRDAMLLIDSLWNIDSRIKKGRLRLGLIGDDPVAIRGAITEIRDESGNPLVSADPAIRTLFSKTIDGQWIRVEKPIVAQTPEQFLAAVISLDPSLKRQPQAQVGHWRFDVLGVLFPEETAWRESGDGWVFIIRAKNLSEAKRAPLQVYLARAGRAGREDLLTRIPELRPLAKRKVAVVGLGGLGALSALEFARAQTGQLRILDFDIVEPGTVVRWPFGLRASGVAKNTRLRDFIRTEYPFTEIKDWRARVGVASDGPARDAIVLDEILDGIDLLYDATAELGLQYLLADLAAERRIPYLCVSTNEGAWGGTIARIGKDTEGCWRCLQAHLSDGGIPLPSYQVSGFCQPTGCADPAFFGAGFDVAQIALSGVRLAASTLCGDDERGYPSVDWDVEIISWRDSAGKPVAPNWQVFPLKRHPSCRCKNDQ
jgi:molybdopterin/thiamine biosynthesis adenylyltransferase